MTKRNNISMQIGLDKSFIGRAVTFSKFVLKP
jgi:hypothetical protein